MFIYRDLLHLIFSAASRAFDQLFDAAQGNGRDNKKEGQKTHSFFDLERGDRIAFTAAHRLSGHFRTPGKEFSAEN